MTDPLFLIGSRCGRAFEGLPHEVLDSVEDVRRAYAQNSRARWVARDCRSLKLLASAMRSDDRWHRLLVLEQANTPRRELLHALFRVVIAPDEDVRLLPTPQLAAVMADEQAQDLLIGGVVSTQDRALVLYRGNLERLVVPFAWFKATPKGPRPDFERFYPSDFGQTVSLGDYEAGVDAILYEFDADARRRMKDRAIAQDDSFGGALRRLRLARGLSRSDFAPLRAKTIARIERGEVAAPHGRTLALIAKRLGVQADAIGSY